MLNKILSGPCVYAAGAVLHVLARACSWNMYCDVCDLVIDAMNVANGVSSA